MPKKKQELTAKMIENVNKVIETIIEENHISSQTELAERIHCCKEHLTRIKNGQRPMSKTTAQAIIQAFPDRNYPEDWLRGLTPYRSPLEAFRAEWEAATKPLRDFHDIKLAVAQMMKHCGVEWDGDTSVHLVAGEDGLTPEGIKTVNVYGVDFYPWDLKMITDKVFEYLKMELRFAVEQKKNESIRNQPIKSSVVHVTHK